MTADLDAFVLPGDKPPTGEKLQKFIAAAGLASRRHAEVMIEQNRVTVNGKVARLGARVQPGDRVLVNGVEIGPQAPRHFLVNKPTGVITTMDDPQGRPTVSTLAPQAVRVYPVGRLDQDTSGLLLLTNDGELAHRLMHPSYGVEKTYRVLVKGRVKQAIIRQLEAGVELDDGMTAPAKARVVDALDDKSIIELVIHEGRNRQVRRMCDAVGHPVIGLVRTGYGPLALGDLGIGKSRPLQDTEIRRLRKAAGLQPPRQKRGPSVRESEDVVHDGPGDTEAHRARHTEQQEPGKRRAEADSRPVGSADGDAGAPRSDDAGRREVSGTGTGSASGKNGHRGGGSGAPKGLSSNARRGGKDRHRNRPR
ncbi:MAG: pseudouridine synthase [Thermoleophilia bacterium]|nr:pseudouridine synthase [Thermoleophilia bacterium]